MRLALEDDVVRTAAERGVDESMSIAIQEPRDGLRRGAPQLMVEHLMLALQIARAAVGKVNPGGTLIFIGVSVFPDELYAAPRSWAEKAYPGLVFFDTHDRGGHFVAFEQPQLLTQDLRAVFRSVR